MSKAAYLSGKAINITTTTAPHAMSYPITTYFGLQHGHAVALTLGYFFEINYNFKNSDVVDCRGPSYIKNTMEQLYAMFGVKSALECRNKWYRLMDAIGLESSIKKVIISSKYGIDKIVNNINLKRLRNNPVHVSRKTLEDILS
jgi:alcohol dehydrogenase class IV